MLQLNIFTATYRRAFVEESVFYICIIKMEGKFRFNSEILDKNTATSAPIVLTGLPHRIIIEVIY